MNDSWAPEEHERALTRMLAPERRDRFSAVSGSVRGRKKFLQTLAHRNPFDPAMLTKHGGTGDELRAALACRHAPHRCYVLSEDPEMDGSLLPLDEAIRAVFDLGFGTIISCLPGELAYYEGEEPGEHWIVAKEPQLLRGPRRTGRTS